MKRTYAKNTRFYSPLICLMFCLFLQQLVLTIRLIPFKNILLCTFEIFRPDPLNMRLTDWLPNKKAEKEGGMLYDVYTCKNIEFRTIQVFNYQLTILNKKKFKKEQLGLHKIIIKILLLNRSLFLCKVTVKEFQ